MTGAPRVVVEATVATTKGRAIFSYRLTNTGNATLGEFVLAVPAGAALREPAGPPGGLVLYAPADERLIWQSAAPSSDLAPGETLGGFRFRAMACAGPAPYRVRHFAADGRMVGHGTGVTQAPVASPDAAHVLRRSEMYHFPVNQTLAAPAMLSSVRRAGTRKSQRRRHLQRQHADRPSQRSLPRPNVNTKRNRKAMNSIRHSAILPFTAFAALCAITLPARPAQAQSGIFTIGNVVDAAAGGSGSFDVLLTAAGGDLSIGGFSVEPSLSATGVTFTSAGFDTVTPYIFPDSFDQDNGLTLSDETDDPFPNTDLIASDTAGNSSITIADGSTVGVAHISYQFDAADTPGSAYTVDFDSNGTSLSDGTGTVSYPFTTDPGVLTVSPAAAPEPSGVVPFGFTILLTAGLMLRARRRRLAVSEQQSA